VTPSKDWHASGARKMYRALGTPWRPWPNPSVSSRTPPLGLLKRADAEEARLLTSGLRHRRPLHEARLPAPCLFPGPMQDAITNVINQVRRPGSLPGTIPHPHALSSISPAENSGSERDGKQLGSNASAIIKKPFA